MTLEQYYTAPPDSVFNEIKEAAIKIWNTYSDEHGYRTEKLERIQNLENKSDNAWYMVRMFDMSNQAKLISMVSSDTREAILDMLS